MNQNGGGMAQFGQMGLNQFSQMQAPQGGYMLPVMYGQPGMMYPPQMMSGTQGMPMGAQMPMMQIPQYPVTQNQTIPVDRDGGQIERGYQQKTPDMGKRNQSQPQLSSSINPISKPSEGFQQADRYTKNAKSKEYAQMLNYQLQMKNQKQSELQNYEQLQIEKLKQDRLRNGAVVQQGQLTRDANGNIISTKANPSNPNFQSQDWFSHVAHKDEYTDPYRPNIQTSIVQSMNTNSVPDLSLYDQDLRRQRELEQRLQTSKSQSTISQNQERIMKAQEQFSSSIPVSIPNYNRPTGMLVGGESEAIKMRKRQDAIELQREQLGQMEEKKRQRELMALQEKRERELEDLKIERERQEIEARMMNDFREQRQGQKNLQQTNFDASTLNISVLENQQIQNPKSAMKRASAATFSDQADSSGIRVEQRITRELPIEVTTTVKETVNNELMRLRNEMNRQSNSLGEQILGMKSHLMKANERRQQAEEDVKKLQDELKRTQITDEIRQRELYNAFVLTDKPKIHSNNTDKLHQEAVNFSFPERPKPYYNMQDPYLDNYNDDFKKDNHGVLIEQTNHVPVGEYDYTANKIFEKKNLEENYFYDKEEQKDYARQALHVNTDTLFDLPEDYMNRQNLFYGKMGTTDGEDNFDYKDIISKNQNRLNKLDQIEILERQGNLDELDQAIFDLGKSKPFDPNPNKDRMNDTDAFLAFDSRLSRYS